MDKKEIFGSLAVIFFMAILFTEQNTNQWIGLAFIGLTFGGIWKFVK